MSRGLFIEPFHGGSHRAFADGLREHCTQELTLLTLPDGEWRRRMRRGAQELAALAAAVPGEFDFIVATDMLDLPTFLALTRPRFSSLPVMLYMHENQFTYPRLRGTKLNSWFGQINYLSACAADVVAFNSAFHRDDFLHALRTLASQPNNWLVPEAIEAIAAKSTVLPVGVDLAWLDRFEAPHAADASPLVLWNHRWEFDKSPELFARTVRRLIEEGLPFRLAIAGEPGLNPAPELVALGDLPPERLRHFGYADDKAAYARLLWESDIVVSTTRHEFFGVGMVEALYCGCVPLAPAGFNYPALVPGPLQERCLFDTPDDFAAKLRTLLTTPAPDRSPLRASAERFAWPIVAPLWDRALEALASRESATNSVVSAHSGSILPPRT
jgi:glycosyltransferase involved in cell wall biosynthesis